MTGQPGRTQTDAMTSSGASPLQHDVARLARLVRQHAHTSRLMGVDFVPVYRARTAGAIGQAGLAAEPAQAPEPASLVQPVAAAQSAVRVVVEAKPPRSRDRAEQQARLDELRARYEKDAPHKQFVTAHTKIVFGEGDPAARLVFIGEAPGEEEDRTGRPFVGRSGELLTKMIGGMGLKREDVYICNILKTRPPNNATPTGREIEICEPYLREQVSIIAPRVVVTLGLPASRAILKSDESMTKMRGRWRTYTLIDGGTVDVMPTFHPAYVLRNYTEETRRTVWGDLQMVMKKLEEAGA
ncbi:MAG: uracil-DNA glycosylase [Leptolyngbya sp. PLA1]|nr:uracil-DNA glycosylase [Leptolyngbya sp. PLA1]